MIGARAAGARWAAALLITTAAASAAPHETGAAYGVAATPRQQTGRVPITGRVGASQHPQQLLSVVHAHSAASSGVLPLADLARLARQSGLDVVVLAENLGYEFRYAPRGLRLFIEARAAAPTLERYGIRRFLRDIEAARTAAPDLLLLPGVEVPAYYHWSGSLMRGDLTLHDSQRNVLAVLPVDASEDSITEFLRGLPVVGNRHHRHYGAGSLALLLPGLICAGLSFAWLARKERRRPVAGSVLLLAGVAFLYLNFPFSVPTLSPYDPDVAERVEEDLLEYVHQRGGLSFWSMPEAVDYQRRRVGPVDVRLSTHPYPEVLSRNDELTGFGGVYADTVSMSDAGGPWDDALMAFQSGRRATAPWIVGESAFHYSGQAGKELADVITVLLVDERTDRAAFAALAAGRSYAVRRDQGEPDLRLGELSLNVSDAPPGAGAAGPGETLTLPEGGAGAELVVRVTEATGARTPVSIEIVRNGEVHRRFDTTTPVDRSWREFLADDEAGAYYRVAVRAARASYLVSNPVFARRNETGNEARH